MTEHEKAIQETISVRFDILHEYATKHRLGFNELCAVVRDAIAEGSASALRQPRNFCGDCGQRTPAGSVHTCAPAAAVAEADRSRLRRYLQAVGNGDPLVRDEGTRAVGARPPSPRREAMMLTPEGRALFDAARQGINSALCAPDGQ